MDKYVFIDETVTSSKAKMKIQTLIPEYFQTAINKNFINSTYETLFSENNSEYVTGYIGEKPSGIFDSTRDFYIEEKSKDRQNYQLTPAVHSTDQSYVQRYSDIINTFKFHGSNVDSHERILRQDFYSFSPMIDINKFVNFNKYFWVEKGPKTINFYRNIENINIVSSEITVQDHSLNTGDSVQFSGILPSEITENTSYLVKIVDQNIFRIYESQNDIDNNTPIEFSQFFYQETTINFVTDFSSVIGKKYSNILGTVLSNGMIIRTRNDITNSYNFKRYLVEGVGDQIQILEFDEFLGYDSSPYDTQPYDYDETSYISQKSNIDYVTIQRGAKDKNPWSMRNRWFHESVLSDIEQEAALRANKPIIEYVKNIQLYNFGSTGVGTVDVVYSSGDIQSESGKTQLVIDGVDVFDQMRVIVINDQDQERSNAIYEVFGVGNSITFNLIYKMNEMDSVLVTSGNQYQNTYLYLSADSIREGQNRDTSSQDILFQLYDHSGVEIDNSVVYPESNFMGQKLFSYKTDPNSTLDVDIQRQVVTNEFGDIVFVNNLDAESYSYTLDFIEEPILGSYYFKLNDTFRSHWHKSDMKVNQAIIDEFIVQPINDQNQASFQNVFELQQTPISDKNIQPVSIEVFLNGTLLQLNVDYIFSDMFGNSVLINSNYIRISDSIVNNFRDGDHLKVYTYSNAVPTEPINGYYEVPSLVGLTSNYDNSDIFEISRNQIFDHFTQMVTRQTDFIGESTGINNLNDISFNYSRGNKIVQNETPITKTAILNQNEFTDISKSLRYTQKEYVAFYRKFDHAISELSLNGFDSSITYDKWMTEIFNNLNVGKNEQFPFSSQKVNDFAHIPPQPQQLGILPFQVPHIYFDNSLQTPSFMILKHDGSIEKCRSQDFTVDDTFTIDSDFNNNLLTNRLSYAWEVIIRDQFGNVLVPNVDYELVDSQRVRFNNISGSVDVIYIQSIVDKVKLYFENEIYNSSTFRQTVYNPVLNVATVKPNYFIKTDYDINEYNSIMEKHFNRWVSYKGAIYNTNTIYNDNNPFTWNYSGLVSPNGDNLNGSWRAIFDFYYNTQTPNITPWEMLGFMEKPEWWVAEYGVSPYTAQNKTLWNDIRDGIIKHGVRAGTYSELAKPNIYDYMPVDDSGNIRDIPTIFNIVPNSVIAKSDWKFGDFSPLEYEWRKSRYFPIAQLHTLYEMYPTKIVDYFWEPENNLVLFGNTNYPQYVNSETLKRFKNSELKIHDTIDSTGSVIVKNGIQRYIIAHATFSGKSAEFVKDLVNNHAVQMVYSYGGFVDKQNTNFFADNFGLVPNENIHNKVHKSSPIDNIVYSAIMVTRVPDGYQITGYDAEHRKFEFYEPDTTTSSQTINIGGSQAPIFEWEQNVRFYKGTYVRIDNKVYRAIQDHRSSQQFTDDISLWALVNNVPLIGGIQVKKYAKYNTVNNINYEHITSEQQELFNIFYGYQLYLEDRGFIFDTTNELITDFESLAKELFNWILTNPIQGDTLVFSPFAQKFKFNSDKVFTDNLNDFIQDQASVVQNNGIKISEDNLVIFRENGTIEVSIDQSLTTDTINRIRLKTVEIEHIAMFDNETNFGDIIFDPLTSIYQPRFRVNMLRSKDWDGSFKAEGFIIQNDTITSNVDKNAQDFQRFYDDDEILPTNYAQLQKKLVGFQNRDYFRNLQIDGRDAFKFYNGLLKDKGTAKSINKLLRNTFIQNVSDIRVNEEWALKIGEYGASESYSDISVKLRQNDFKSDYQLVSFIDGNEDDLSNSIIEIYENDPRFIFKRKSEFDTTTFNTQFSNPQMPYAGYPLLSESDIFIFKYDDTVSEYVNTTFAGDISTGTRVWVSDIGNNDWNVYRLFNTSIVVSEASISNAQYEFIVNDSQYVDVNDVVFLDQELKFPMKVVSVPSSTTILVEPFGAVENVTLANISNANLYTLESVRFASLQEFDQYTPNEAYNEKDIFFIDNINDKYCVIDKDKNVIRVQNQKIDYSQFVNASVMTDDNIKILEMDTYHPNIGRYPQSVNINIDYITPFDPVNYAKDVTLWTNEKVGSVWWNIDDVRFLDYDQQDELYRLNNWGKIFPGQQMSIYQWIKSPFSPDRWADFLETEKGKSHFQAEQAPLNTVDYITIKEYNSRTGLFENVYYFWVQNNEYIFTNNTNKKTLSVKSIKNILENPTKQGIRWISPIDKDSFIIQNVTNVLTDTTKLVITFKDFPTENKIHTEWYLIGDKTDGRLPPTYIFDKVKHSLSGFLDISGTLTELYDQGIQSSAVEKYTINSNNGIITLRIPVPDENITTTSKYGSSFRPRQSWFKDVVMSRQAFIHSTNKLMQRSTWVDSESKWADYLYIEDPQPEVYDYKVASLFDRDALINEISFGIGSVVLVENDISLHGRWQLWEFDGSQFVLLKSQGFRMTDYWDFGNYVKDGENIQNVFISKTYTNFIDRNMDLPNLRLGVYIKVIDESTNITTIYKVVEDNDTKYFDLIMKENATFVFDYNICTCPFGDTAFGIMYDVFINELSTTIDKNNFIVDMILEAFRQHKFIDWAFKTSYVDISGIEEELNQNPIFTTDLTDNIIMYFNEVKPYHTKIRGLIDKKYSTLDNLDINYIDDHEVETTIYFDRVSCTANLDLLPAQYTAAERMESNGFDSSEIEGCYYSQYTIDNKGFKFFENIYGVGYDTSQYDASILGYDYNNDDVDALYDAVINGKTFSTISDDIKDTIIDGGAFYQPLLSENSPPELAKFRMGDTLSMDVYSMPYNITIDDGYDPETNTIPNSGELGFIQRPKMIQDLYLTNSSNLYSISQIPQQNDSVFVYVDNVLLSQDLYSIIWDKIKPSITLDSSISDESELKILSYSIGGYASAVYEKVFNNVSSSVITIDTELESTYTVVTVLNGIKVANQTKFTGDTSLSNFEIKIPQMSAGDNVYIVVYNGDEFQDVYTQSFEYNGFVAQIQNPSGPEGRQEENTFVYKNGVRVPPSYIKYYMFSDATNEIRANEKLYSKDYIKVYNDGILIPDQDYSVDFVSNSIKFNTSLLANSEIVVVNDIAAEFRIEDTDFYLHTKAVASNILSDVPVNSTLSVNSISTTFVRPDNTGVIPVDRNLGDFHVKGSSLSLTNPLGISEILQINNGQIEIESTDTIQTVVSKINAKSFETGVNSYIDVTASTIVLKQNGRNFVLSGNWNQSFGIQQGNYFNLVTQIQNNIGNDYRVSTVDGRLRIVNRNGSLNFNLVNPDLQNYFGFDNSYTSTGASVKVVTMDDNAHNYMKTEVFEGNLLGEYPIYQLPTTENATNIQVVKTANLLFNTTDFYDILNSGLPTPIHGLIYDRVLEAFKSKTTTNDNGDMNIFNDFEFSTSELGYDMYFYGNTYDSGNFNTVQFKVPHYESETIISTTYSGAPRNSKYAFKMLKTLNNKFEYYEINDDKVTSVKQVIRQGDDNIHIHNYEQLAQPQKESNIPAYIWVDGEVIGYYTITQDGDDAILSDIIRGAKGTAFGVYNTIDDSGSQPDKYINIGTPVLNLSDNKFQIVGPPRVPM